MGERSIAGTPVKCIVVGDPEVGKTCLMLAFVRQDGSFEYNPSSVDSYTVGMTINTRKISLFLQDTAGSESYDAIRMHCYAGSQVAVLVFSLISEGTLDSIATKWAPEVHRYARNCPVMLVGTFNDLAGAHAKITSKARHVARQIGAAQYLEVCSTARNQATDVFTAAACIGSALTSPQMSSRSRVSLASPPSQRGRTAPSGSPSAGTATPRAQTAVSAKTTPTPPTPQKQQPQRTQQAAQARAPPKITIDTSEADNKSPAAGVRSVATPGRVVRPQPPIQVHEQALQAQQAAQKALDKPVLVPMRRPVPAQQARPQSAAATQHRQQASAPPAPVPVANRKSASLGTVGLVQQPQRAQLEHALNQRVAQQQPAGVLTRSPRPVDKPAAHKPPRQVVKQQAATAAAAAKVAEARRASPPAIRAAPAAVAHADPATASTEPASARPQVYTRTSMMKHLAAQPRMPAPKPYDVLSSAAAAPPKQAARAPQGGVAAPRAVPRPPPPQQQRQPKQQEAATAAVTRRPESQPAQTAAKPPAERPHTAPKQQQQQPQQSRQHQQKSGEKAPEKPKTTTEKQAERKAPAKHACKEAEKAEKNDTTAKEQQQQQQEQQEHKEEEPQAHGEPVVTVQLETPRSVLEGTAERGMANVNVAVSQTPLFHVWLYRNVGLQLRAASWGDSTEHYLLKLKTRAGKCRMYFLNERNKTSFKTLVGQGSLLAVQDSSRFFVLNLPEPLGIGFRERDEAGKFVVEYMKRMYEARNYKGKRSVRGRKKEPAGAQPHSTDEEDDAVFIDLSVEPEVPSPEKTEYNVYQSLEDRFVAALQHDAQHQPDPHQKEAQQKQQRREKAINAAIASAKPILRATVSRANIVQPLGSSAPPRYPAQRSTGPSGVVVVPAAPSFVVVETHPPPEPQAQPQAPPAASPAQAPASPRLSRAVAKLKKLDERYAAASAKRCARSVQGARARAGLMRAELDKADKAFLKQVLGDARRALERMAQDGQVATVTTSISAASFTDSSSSSDDDDELPDFSDEPLVAEDEAEEDDIPPPPSPTQQFVPPPPSPRGTGDEADDDDVPPPPPPPDDEYGDGAADDELAGACVDSSDSPPPPPPPLPDDEDGDGDDEGDDSKQQHEQKDKEKARHGHHSRHHRRHTSSGKH